MAPSASACYDTHNLWWPATMPSFSAATITIKQTAMQNTVPIGSSTNKWLQSERQSLLCLSFQLLFCTETCHCTRVQQRQFFQGICVASCIRFTIPAKLCVPNNSRAWNWWLVCQAGGICAQTHVVSAPAQGSRKWLPHQPPWLLCYQSPKPGGTWRFAYELLVFVDAHTRLLRHESIFGVSAERQCHRQGLSEECWPACILSQVDFKTKWLCASVFVSFQIRRRASRRIQ